MCEPLMMSKQIFDAAAKDQRDAIMAVGAELEKFGTEGAKADDRGRAASTRSGREGVRPRRGDAQEVAGHRPRTAWKDYAEKSESCAKILQAAEKLFDAAVEAGSSPSRPRLPARPARAPVGAAPASAQRVDHPRAIGGLLARRLILTYSVFVALFLQGRHDWQDEAAVFCIVAAVFPARRYVQSYRGHIGIERSRTSCRRAPTASARSWSTSRRSCSAPSSRGSRDAVARGLVDEADHDLAWRRRCGFPTASWRSA
jgi:hypothetical protein